MLELIRQKLAVRGNDPPDTSAERLSALRRQVEGELAPVVPASDFEAFDLDRAFEMIAAVAGSLKA